MKIILLTNILSPYRKIFYDELYSQFLKKGHDFHVLVMSANEDNREWKYEEYKADYTILLNCRTIKFKNIYFHLNDNIKETICELYPDILIASGSYISPSVYSVIRMRKRLGYKLFFWSESHLNESRSYSKTKLLLRDLVRKVLYNKFDGFWYAGKKSLEFIQKYYRKKGEFCFVPNLVDGGLFHEAALKTEEWKKEIRNSLKIDLKKYVLLIPARLAPVKGIMPFLELFIQCKYKENCILLIAGEGECREKIKEYIDECGIDARMTGYVSNQNQLIDFYAIADVFLLPSLSDPNPLSCIEALWAGLPLLVSEHVGNYPEIVSRGINGYVFSYSNKEEAVKIIDNVISQSKEWYESAKKASINIAREKYGVSTAVEKIVSQMVGKA